MNQLLQKDTAIFSPALRALFQFDYLLKKAERKKNLKREDDPFKAGGKSHRDGTMPSLFFNEHSRRNSSEDKNHIMESEGQVEDYFNSGKDPFDNNNSPNNNEGSFLVSGMIT